jgi:hypothetical protein
MLAHDDPDVRLDAMSGTILLMASIPSSGSRDERSILGLELITPERRSVIVRLTIERMIPRMIIFPRIFQKFPSVI